VLSHAFNLGKGRALKTGLNYFALHCPKSRGVVTCDADGQHAAADILKIAQRLEQSPGKELILGVREFPKAIPLRSRIGNILTRHIFRFLVGEKITDTQTGLRGIGRDSLPLYIGLSGERYEYETNMLISAHLDHIRIVQEPIQTIYLDDNKASHFNPFFDSIRIYFLFVRFAFSSLLSSMADLVTFLIAYHLTANVTASVFVGRFTVGPLVNFSVNKRFVFHDRGRLFAVLARYYALATVLGLTASILIEKLNSTLGVNIVVSKILVESVLFFASFSVQRDYIFIQKPDER
jgi:putative flippase GtrA